MLSRFLRWLLGSFGSPAQTFLQVVINDFNIVQELALGAMPVLPPEKAARLQELLTEGQEIAKLLAIASTLPNQQPVAQVQTLARLVFEIKALLAERDAK